MMQQFLLASLVAAAIPISSFVADTTRTPVDSQAAVALPADLVPDTVGPDTAAFEISIGRLLIDDMHLDDTLDVFLNTHGHELGAFDLKIAVDNPIVDIVNILPGRYQDSCRWQFFNVHQVKTDGREDYPTQLWQVVAMARSLSGNAEPLCYSLDGDAVLLRLVLSNARAQQTPDQKVPIFFFWEDCSDNTLASRSGNTLMISRHVYDYFADDRQKGSKLFPSRIGAPAECIKPNVINPQRRLVDFHNGGVEFKLDVGNVRPVDSSAQSPPNGDN